MDDERSVKKQTGRQTRKKKKGRPRLRWMDYVELDFMNMGVVKWRARDLDSTQREPVVREAKGKFRKV